MGADVGGVGVRSWDLVFEGESGLFGFGTGSGVQQSLGDARLSRKGSSASKEALKPNQERLDMGRRSGTSGRGSNSGCRKL